MILSRHTLPALRIILAALILAACITPFPAHAFIGAGAVPAAEGIATVAVAGYGASLLVDAADDDDDD